VIERFKLLEILNTSVEVDWRSTDNGVRGQFTLDGELFEIVIDEYEVSDKILVDFGFTRNGKIDAINSNINASKILGAVLNASIPKIKEANPDFIMIAVFKKSGLVESRKSLYELLCRWFQKRLGTNYISDWQESSEAFFKIMALKDSPSEEELGLFMKATTK